MTEEQREHIDTLLKELDTLVAHNKTFKEKILDTIGKKLSLAEYQQTIRFLTRVYMEAPDNNYLAVDVKIKQIMNIVAL